MINQKIFDAAAKSRTAKSLVEHLKTLEPGQELVESAASLVRFSGYLIDKRPNPKGASAREEFLMSIRNALLDGGAEIDLKNLDRAVELIHTTEEGLHRVLAALSETQFSREPAAVRASAILARVEKNRAALVAEMEAAIKTAAHLTMPGTPEITTANGNRIDADAFIARLLEALRGALVMEGYANGWFTGPKRWLVLPALPAVGDREIDLAFQSEFLASSWAWWERMCEKARYFDEEIEAHGAERISEEPVEGVVRVFERASIGPIVDFIANERAIEREAKSAADFFGRTNVLDVGQGISGIVKPAPVEWVSSYEALAAVALSEGVGFDISKDSRRYGGLTLLQWIRGYMALEAWVSDRPTDEQSITAEFSPEIARDLLVRMSFDASEAEIFLDAISFGANSRDLYDAPLIRTQDRWLLVGAALTAPRMAKIVPSLLASMKIQIADKGAGFEQRVIELLKSQRLDARQVKVKRDKETYDYDILVPWGSYVFHFECKNHGLSGNDPKNCYHFLQETVSNLKQVARLREGLKKWPDILTEEFGENGKGKTVVHCILNNETFSIPGGIDETFLYDWSALSRFFESPSIGIVQDHRGPGDMVIRSRIDVKRVWAGDEPTPEDLLEELRNPSQYQVVQHHVEVQTVRFRLDKETVAIDRFFVRTPSTPASYAEALGVPGGQIEKHLAETSAKLQTELGRLRAEIASRGE